MRSCENIFLCKATGCEIPLIVESCVAAIEKNGKQMYRKRAVLIFIPYYHFCRHDNGRSFPRARSSSSDGRTQGCL